MACAYYLHLQPKFTWNPAAEQLLAQPRAGPLAHTALWIQLEAVEPSSRICSGKLTDIFLSLDPVRV